MILGTSATTLTPKGGATRAQVAVILSRFCQEYIGRQNTKQPEEAPITPVTPTVPKNVTVSFDLNYSTEDKIEPVTVNYGEKVSKPANPSRKNYIFGGWSTSKNGGLLYNFNRAVTSDITLYARWSSESDSDSSRPSIPTTPSVPVTPSTYTVMFYMNDGTGAVYRTSSVTSGSSVSTPVAPSRDGYTFGGWYTDTSTTTAYSFSSAVTRNLNLYAKWDAIPVFTVTFYTNNGTDDVYTTSSVTSGDTVSLPAAPTRDGYTFGGWYTDADTTSEYSFDSAVIQDLNLYAKWDAIPVFTVTFYMNDGTDGVYTTSSVTSGDTVLTPATPTRDGHTFSGWYTDADTTSEYSFDSVVIQDLNLYAKWDAIPVFTVTFYTNNGTDDVYTTSSVTSGDTVSTPAAPTRDGYTFGGWYTDADATSEYSFDSAVIQDLNLYAKWDAIPVFTVTFHMNDGTDDNVYTTSSVTSGNAVPIPAAPTRDGYTFGGWYTDADTTSEYSFDSVVIQDLILYAKWYEIIVPDVYYTVIFVSNGVSDAENMPSAQTVKSGEYATVPAVPIRSGYTFDGWYVDEELTSNYDFNTAVTANVTLYAKWTLVNPFPVDPNAQFVVTFVLNDGSDSIYEVQTIAAYGTIVEPEEPVHSVYGDMYRFTGWYTEGSTVTLYDFNTQVTNNFVLYAGWGNPEGDDDGIYSVSSGGGTVYSIAGIELGLYEVNTTINANATSILVVEFLDENEYWDIIDNGDISEEARTEEEIQVALKALTPITTLAIQTPSYCEMYPISIPIAVNNPVLDYTHYVIRAHLVDENLVELCSYYYCTEYTTRYEEFSKQTISDIIEEYGYTEDQIIPFDEHGENFGVFTSDVKIIESNNTFNVVTVQEENIGNEGSEDISDEEESISLFSGVQYIFSNIDSTVENLNVGDKVYVNGTSYLFKIGSIKLMEDGRVSLIPDNDIELTDFYDIMRVDMDDNHTNEKYSVQPYLDVIDVDSSFTKSFSQSLLLDLWKNEAANKKITLTGSVSGSIKVAVKMAYDVHLFGKDHFSCSVTVTASAKAEAKLAAEINNMDKVIKEWKATKVSIPTNVPGLIIYFQPSIPMEWKISASGSLTFSADLTEGFSYNTGSGIHWIDKKTYKNSIKFQGEAELKFGPKIAVGIAFLEKVAKAEGNIQAGIKGTLTVTTGLGQEWTNEESTHACSLCLNGKADWFVAYKQRISFQITKKLTKIPYDATVFEVGGPIAFGGLRPGLFYISVLNSKDSIFLGKLHWGFDSCPNKQWRTYIETKNADGEAITGIVISIAKHDSTYSSSGKSRYKTYLYDGIYTLTGEIDGTVASKTFTVNGSAQTIILTPDAANGKIVGTVKDANTDAYVGEADIIIVQDKLVVASAKSTSVGNFTIELPVGTFDMKISKSGYISSITRIVIESGRTVYPTVKLSPGKDEEGKGGFSGRIVDAVTGSSIEGVKLQVRSGTNNSDGKILKEMTTNGNGEYDATAYTLFENVLWGFDAGSYTVTATKEGYETKSFNAIVLAGVANNLLPDISLSPALASGTYRIVLTWDINPSDLDSHVVGTLTNGNSFHVYYSYKSQYDSGTEVCNLDIDDTNSYGPETITLIPTTSYPYYYYIYHYAGNGSISTSVAHIDVYDENGLVTSFDAPTDQGTGRYWNVFAISDGRLVVRNTITSSSETNYASIEGHTLDLTGSTISEINTFAEDNAIKPYAPINSIPSKLPESIDEANMIDSKVEEN